MTESLDRYVRRVLREKGLTLSDVAKRSLGGISRGYICEISRGNYKDLTIKKLQALALGLDVPEDVIFDIARGVDCGWSDEREFARSRLATLYARYSELAPEDRREVAILLEAVEREVERRRTCRPLDRSALWAAAAAERIEALFGCETSQVS